MGKIVSGATQALGLTADPNAGAGAAASQMQMYKRAMEELDKLQIPDIEKQKLALEIPQLVGLQQAEQLGDTALADIAPDAQSEEAQRSALTQLKELSEKGFSEEDRAAMRQMQRQVGAEEKARQQSILSDMAQRGVSGGGQELAARLASSQASASRAAEGADRLAIQQAQARRAALSQLGQQAGAFRGQQFQEQSSAAKARDAINQFNAMQRAQAQQANLAQRQAIENQRAATLNQQQAANKGLIQQQYQNQLQKATGMQSAMGNVAQAYGQQAQAQAQAAQAEAAGTRGLLLGAATAGASYMTPTAATAATAATAVPKKLQNGGVKYENGGLAEDIDKETENMYNNKEVPAEFIQALQALSELTKKSEMKDEEVMEDIQPGEFAGASGQAESDVNDLIHPMTHEERDMYANGGIEERLYGRISQYRDRGYDDMYGDRDIRMTDDIAKERNKVLRDILEKKSPKKVLTEDWLGRVKLTEDERLRVMQEVEKNQEEGPYKDNLRQQIIQNIERGRKYYNGGIEEQMIESSERMADGGRVDEAIDNGELAVNDNAQDELLEVLRGLRSPEEMEEGRIIEGDSYSGDLLPDRINSGESVNTVMMQDRNKEMLKDGADAKAELDGLRKLLQMVGSKK